MGELALRVGEARSELARTAVARERLRFATDLHDLLGLGLSVLVLKSELALRLLYRDPDRARDELSEGLAAARRTRRHGFEPEQTMRKIIASTYATLDGFIDNPHEWSLRYSEEEARTYAFTMTAHADALLLSAA
nr:histidine kinase [Actinomadura bangladeshensis]